MSKWIEVKEGRERDEKDDGENEKMICDVKGRR